mmetsp:Transcript_3859/g.3652  ORF Transcript_3859/g.3652 Transcript_3859/m.3652 type:complete len:84 (-) Transcript_3859:263-514(-)
MKYRKSKAKNTSNSLGSFLWELLEPLYRNAQKKWYGIGLRGQKNFKEFLRMDQIIIVSMNDAYVMQHFAKKLDYGDRISYIAD